MAVLGIPPAAVLDRALVSPRRPADLTPRDPNATAAPPPAEADVLSGRPLQPAEQSGAGPPAEGFRRPPPDATPAGPTYPDQPGQPGTPLQRAYADLWPPLWPPVWPPVWHPTEATKDREQPQPLPQAPEASQDRPPSPPSPAETTPPNADPAKEDAARFAEHVALAQWQARQAGLASPGRARSGAG